MDGLIPFLAMGVHLGVWEEPVKDWILGTSPLPNLPCSLTVKEKFRWTSITQAMNDKPGKIYTNKHQPEVFAIPNPQAYKSLTTSALAAQFRKVAALLGWTSESTPVLCIRLPKCPRFRVQIVSLFVHSSDARKNTQSAC